MNAIKHNDVQFYKTPFLCVEKFNQKAIPTSENTADMLYNDFNHSVLIVFPKLDNSTDTPSSVCTIFGC